MPKIGIVTFHDTVNYGASMQCYALQKKLSLMGADAEVIDYKCPKFEKEYSPFYISKFSFRKILYMIFAFKMNVIKQKKKKLFQQKNINMSQSYTPSSIASANSKYDIFITGSDQVWNWHLTNFDKTFFLDFVESGKKKCSYAASFGISEIEQEKRQEYQELLKGFDSVSVREESGSKIYHELTGLEPEIVVDPVLLLSGEEWEKVLKRPPITEGYIVLYSINDTKAYQCALELASRTKKKLVYLNAPLKKHGNFEKITKLGPDEFVGWFRYADYVITDSFHGVITSVLFRKQFLALQDRRQTANTNSRINDFLRKINLTNRIIEDVSQIDLISEPTDYKPAEDILNRHIQKSVDFLKNIIGDTHE